MVCLSHMLACARVLLVTVYAFKLNCFSVDGEQIAMHFDFTHSKTPMNCFDNLIFIVCQI